MTGRDCHTTRVWIKHMDKEQVAIERLKTASEKVRFVQEDLRRLELKGIKCIVNYPVYKGKRTSMWKLIPQKLMPPSRWSRYCCSVLKERGGGGRFIATGVRWAESVKRKTTGAFMTKSGDPSKKIVLNNDNDDRRMLFENCRLQAKRIRNPVIDWTDTDIWAYIEAEKFQSTRFINAVFPALIALAVQWPEQRTVKNGLPVIQNISGTISSLRVLK